MGHAYCMDCSGVISCGYGSCERCEGKIKPCKQAHSQGFFNRCDDCFAKLPKGATSPFVDSMTKHLKDVNSNLNAVETDIRILEEKRKELESTKNAIEKDLNNYKATAEGGKQ